MALGNTGQMFNRFWSSDFWMGGWGGATTVYPHAVAQTVIVTFYSKVFVARLKTIREKTAKKTRKSMEILQR